MMESLSPWPEETHRAPYASFWMRLVAYILDNIIIGFVLAILFVILMIFMKIEIFKETDDPAKPEFSSAFYGLMFFGLFISWIYYAVMESSKYQATVGKMTLSLIVTDLNGNRLSFAHASARFFAKLISNLTIYIGYFVALFTRKKQALHDLIAATLVLRNE